MEKIRFRQQAFTRHHGHVELFGARGGFIAQPFMPIGDEVAMPERQSNRCVDRGQRCSPYAHVQRRNRRQGRRGPRTEEVTRPGFRMFRPLMAGREHQMIEARFSHGAVARLGGNDKAVRVAGDIDDATPRFHLDRDAIGLGLTDQRLELVLEEFAERQTRIKSALIDLARIDTPAPSDGFRAGARATPPAFPPTGESRRWRYWTTSRGRSSQGDRAFRSPRPPALRRWSAQTDASHDAIARAECRSLSGRPRQSPPTVSCGQPCHDGDSSGAIRELRSEERRRVVEYRPHAFSQRVDRERLSDQVHPRIEHSVMDDRVLYVAGREEDPQMRSEFSRSSSASRAPFISGMTTSVNNRHISSCASITRSASFPLSAARTR